MAVATAAVYAALADGAGVYDRALAAGLRPKTKLTVSEWADKNRFLTSKIAAAPMPWRTSRVPYMREVMDALSPSHPCESVALRKGSQLAGTECGNNWIAFIIDQAPGSVLIVLPTTDAAKKWSKQRLTTLIEDTPVLRGKVASERSRDRSNTILTKDFPGGILFLTGANSPTGLRSMPAKYIFLDEIDAYPGDVGGEGDPIRLAEKRQQTFRHRKSFKVSTPVDHATSRIDREYEDGDQRQYFVPCPHCGFFQVLLFPRLQYSPAEKPEHVAYECHGCHELIEERWKTQMLERGIWVPTFERSDLIEAGFQASDLSSLDRMLRAKATARRVTFHISSLYSPIGWASWLSIAEQWVKDQGDSTRLKTFVNTVLGESWKDRADAPDWKVLYHQRRESYPLRRVPRGGLFLTAGVDVQADRIEAQLKAWGRGNESWVVDYIVLPGRPSEPAVWEALDEVLDATIPNECGVQMPIVRMAVDSGYSTQDVYAWGRRHLGDERVLIVKGEDGKNNVPLGQPKPVDLTLGGKLIRGGCKYWPVYTWELKSQLYTWLRKEQPENPADGFPEGYCHFPELDAEFFRQLTAEQFVTKIVRGRTRQEWVKQHRNEALDTAVYARAAAVAFGVLRFREKHWAYFERSLSQLQLPVLAEAGDSGASEGGIPVAESAVVEPSPSTPAETKSPARLQVIRTGRRRGVGRVIGRF